MLLRKTVGCALRRLSEILLSGTNEGMTEDIALCVQTAWTCGRLEDVQTVLVSPPSKLLY